MLVYLRALHAKKAAFTLIEVLISALILSFVVAGVFMVLNVGRFSISVNSVKLQTQQESRTILDWIVKDLRQTTSSEIIANEPSASHIKFRLCNGYSYEDQQITWGNYIEYTYNGEEKKLTRQDYGTGRLWQFYDVSGIIFDTTLLSQGKLGVSVGVQKQTSSGLILYSTLSSEVEIRNG
jgi:type II secretory pathway pseudopilin PulG